MSWQTLMTAQKIKSHSTSKRELDDLRDVIERDLLFVRLQLDGYRLLHGVIVPRITLFCQCKAGISCLRKDKAAVLPGLKRLRFSP